MPTLSFDGETHEEIKQKVRRWLSSQDGGDEVAPTVHQTVSQGAELTKDALRIIASAASDPVAESDVVKGLTNMGYKATDATKSAVLAGLESIEEATGGGVVRQVSTAGRRAVFEMNSQIAKQLLKTLVP